jgi:hypothetical protein
MNYMLLALSLTFTAVPVIIQERAVPVITLERSECFGACPVYTLTIYDNGKVEYEGLRAVKHKGKAEGQITVKAVEELVREFEKIDYFNLASYSVEGKHCPQLWTDFPTVTTSLNWKGKKKTVVHNHGCRGNAVLEKLDQLEIKIDEVANTKCWVVGG